MRYDIRSIPVLRKTLWLDAFLGGSSAISGLCFPAFLAPVLSLQQQMILVISLITLVYAIVAASLAGRKQIPVTGVRILVYANWLWAFVSIMMFIVYAKETTLQGTLFLVGQVVVVGGLAYLEGRQVIRKNG